MRRGHTLTLCLFTLVALTPPNLSADSRPSGPSPDLDALPPNAQQIYKDTTLFPRQAKWLGIPWLNDLNKGIQAAKDEKRPLLLWVSGDDPLERC